MNPTTLPHHAFGSDPKAAYRAWLVKMCRGMKTVAEVGAFAGSTTIKLARDAGVHVIAVDHWQGVPDDPLQAGIYRDPERTKQFFHRRLRPWLRKGRVEVMEMDSLEAAAWIGRHRGRCLDLVFLDADHSYEAVAADIQAWAPLVKPGGILCGHDINWPGVSRAVREAFPAYQRGGGFIWWVEVEA